MLHRITLHLARSPGFPSGSARHGYEIIAPLDSDGILSVEEWRKHRASCLVRRFWAGDEDRKGNLIHRAGGSGGATWLVDYDEDRSDDDEAGYRLDLHTFNVGEYVTIKDVHGQHTFRVVDLETLPAE